MKTNLLLTIKENMDSFSKGQKKIANYLLTNYEKSVYLTAFKLSEVVGVSESTVVRFAIELGFEGYPEFQRALEEIVKSELTPRQRMEVTSDKLTKKNKHQLQVIMERDADKIYKTLNDVDFSEFDKVIDKLVDARKIYIIAGRSSSALGSFMAFYLNTMNFNVELVEVGSRAEIFELLMRGSSDDVCVCISFPRYAKRTIQGIEFAKRSGITTVSITDSHLAPCAKYSDHVILAKSDMISVVDSLVAPLSIINGILVALSIKKEKSILDNFDVLDKLWKEYDIYATDNFLK